MPDRARRRGWRPTSRFPPDARKNEIGLLLGRSRICEVNRPEMSPNPPLPIASRLCKSASPPRVMRFGIEENKKALQPQRIASNQNGEQRTRTGNGERKV